MKQTLVGVVMGVFIHQHIFQYLRVYYIFQIVASCNSTRLALESIIVLVVVIFVVMV